MNTSSQTPFWFCCIFFATWDQKRRSTISLIVGFFVSYIFVSLSFIIIICEYLFCLLVTLIIINNQYSWLLVFFHVFLLFPSLLFSFPCVQKYGNSRPLLPINFFRKKNNMKKRHHKKNNHKNNKTIDWWKWRDQQHFTNDNNHNTLCHSSTTAFDLLYLNVPSLEKVTKY